MRKSLLFIFLASHFAQAQPKANELLPKVDQRMELMAIIFQLAKQTKTEQTHNPAYTSSIVRYFQPYQNHELVKLVKDKIKSFEKDNLDISQWELPSLAVHIGQPPEFKLLASLTDTTKTDGWDDRTLLNEQMIGLLKKFYIDTKAEQFFKTQEPYYKKCEAQYLKDNIQINKEWISKFIGLPPTESYFPILSPYFAMGAYMRVNFKNNARNTHSLFTITIDDPGNPNLNDRSIPWLLVHECVHKMANQLVDKHKKELRKSAEILLAKPEVWEKVQNTFYNNWEFLLYESLVRACSIKYMCAEPAFKTNLETEIALQQKAGFIWMGDLVAKLNLYEKSRGTYGNLESFMPVLTSVFTRAAKK